MRFNKLFMALTAVFALALVRCDTVFEDDLTCVGVDLTSPVDGAEVGTTLVQFEWDSIKEVITYEFQIASPMFSDENALIVADEEVDTNSASKTLEEGEYEWRVKAINSSSESSYSVSAFTVTGEGDISGFSPVFLSPLDSEFTNEDPINFEWESMTGASEYTVRIFDYTNSVEGEQIHINTVTDTVYTTSLDEGMYLARLQGGDGNSQLSGTSQRSFTLDLTPPSQPIVDSPDNADFNSTELITFNYTSGQDILSSVTDSIFVYTISPSVIVYSSESTDGFQLEASELGAGNYDWSVITYDQAGNSTESSVLLFSINE